ncbi:MAG: 4-hydroxy-tetrahydrodipicolinate reductase [Wigglesworthia glossinidia]|nr:4-hydroxy-tetrahydrodipicolinate reductase [Wigglesworthia glossinidia]
MKTLNHHRIRIITTGANGKMGSQITRTALNFPQIVHVAALVRNKSPFAYQDIGKLANITPIGILAHDNIEEIKSEFDILIDFTSPNSSLEYLDFCCKNKKNIIIGTTGFDKYQKKIIKKMSKYIAIFFSSNFSYGISIILNLLEKTLHTIDINNFDIDIIEMHHKKKIDTPSSTAIEIHNCIKNKLKNNINITSIRLGDIVGEHKIIFSFFGEKIEITHCVHNRNAFSLGVIKAAIWLYQKQPGLFDMKNIFNK